MRIEKVLNNNVIVALDEHGAETVLMGRGLGFGRKAGDAVPADRIEKRFTLHSDRLLGKFEQLLASIPLQHFLLSERIIEQAKAACGLALSDSIYVTLPDHISAAIERYQQGIRLPNPLLWDIRQFYRDEFAAGLKANELIREETGIAFDEEEAGFIAMHFVNAQVGGEVCEVYDMTCLIQEVFRLVQERFDCEPDRDSTDFYRFITHLKFFARRIAAGEPYGDEDADLLAAARRKYPKAHACARAVCAYVRRERDFDPGQNELLYLTLHIARVTGRAG